MQILTPPLQAFYRICDKLPEGVSTDTSKIDVMYCSDSDVFNVTSSADIAIDDNNILNVTFKDLSQIVTELEDGATAELDFAVTELELVSPTAEETGGGVAELVALTAELERDSTVAQEVVSAAELEVGSTLVPELESGVTCGAVGVLLLSQAFQKNAVIASKIFFQCLYINPPPYERYSSPLI